MNKILKIHARPASKIVADLSRRRIPVDGLLKEAGLRRADLQDPDARVPYSAVVSLMERAAALLGEPGFGLRLGASQDISDSGLIGFVMLNSAKLVDAVNNLHRYFLIVGDGEEFDVVQGGPHVVLRFRESDPALRGLRQNSEYIAAIVVRACRDMTRKRVSPVRVEFMHSRPNAKVDYEAILGCPVRFRADWDSIVFATKTMQLPVIGADHKLLQALEMSCQKILGPTPKKRDIVHDVRALIVEGLTRGTAQIDAVASKLGMSSKTLERRLRIRDQLFSALLDAIRQDLAKQYLSETDFRLEQVAYLTGYSEPAALVRAFKRWTGKTPMQFRIAGRQRPAFRPVPAEN
jgi:AraC-like DNA-binding protein